MGESRTRKSIRNIRFALGFYFINLLLNFFSRKVFIEYLGAELLGLNTTIINLLGFLNLAELGIGNAVAFILYKPLYENKTEEINEIVSVQGWLYRKIAYLIIILSVILLVFFPWFFGKSDLSIWYAYSTFFVLMISSLLTYFVSYRQIVLTADQKEYLVTVNYQGVKFFKVLLQILAIYYFSNGYIYWLIIELGMSSFMAFNINRIVKRQYPWLISKVSEGKVNKSKYPLLIEKTKQLFFHKIGEFVLTQTTPLIIYWYASFTLVTIYGNYMLIVSGVTLLINSIFNSLTAGIGNLVAEGKLSKIENVFEESLVIRIWIVSVVCFGMYMLSNSFVSLWIGEEYLIDKTALILIIVITFVNLTRVASLFIAAYGLYKDIWAPIVEAVLNLGLSIGLGYFYGLNGILLGSLISLLFIIVIWKPFLLYKYAFKRPVREYWTIYIKNIILIVGSYIISKWIINFINISFEFNALSWLIYALKVVFIYTFISFVIFYIFTRGMKFFWNRVLCFLFNKR